jgi:hypothetical protein
MYCVWDGVAYGYFAETEKPVGDSYLSIFLDMN